MIVGIHQPHYFPWLGYFNKMYRSDLFVLLDEVQMEKGSFMYRNRILDNRGEVKYITIPAEKHGYLEKKYSEIKVNKDIDFLEKHKQQIIVSYKDRPFFHEVWSQIEDYFSESHETVCDYCISSIRLIKTLLHIETRIVIQREIDSSGDLKKNDLVLDICKKMSASEYISGNGARKYNDEDSFNNAGIILSYQQYVISQYNQGREKEFVPGLSVLDVLFNCGIKGTEELVKKTDC